MSTPKHDDTQHATQPATSVAAAHTHGAQAPDESAHDEGHVHGPGCSHHHVGQTYIRATPKVGRNDPCPCGSGKKAKKCCVESC